MNKRSADKLEVPKTCDGLTHQKCCHQTTLVFCQCRGSVGKPHGLLNDFVNYAASSQEQPSCLVGHCSIRVLFLLFI